MSAPPLNVLSLFAGVGGMELGLERAGMTTVAQVEIDPYCQRVLARHWPEVPRHDDVLTFPEWWIIEGGLRPSVDVVCAGFPCQPFSLAGKQLGTNDERWMWPATAAAIRAVRPAYVLLENVSALVRDAVAFGAVLGDLHALGFDAEWATLRASDFGAPTPRASMGSHGIAWVRAETGKHRSQLEDYVAWLWLRSGRQRISGLQLNPEWTDWLMGFPTNHTACDAPETPSSQQSPSASGD